MPTTPTPITALPTPVPQASDPANFASRADALLTALPTFVSETNAVATNAHANAAEADTDATAAQSSARSVSTSATAAATSAAAAAASAAAAAASAPGGGSSPAAAGSPYISTSTTSLSVSTGSKAITLADTGRAFAVGDPVTIIRRTAPAIRMSGLLTAVDASAATFTINVTAIGGSGGPFTDWICILTAFAGDVVIGRHAIPIAPGAMQSRGNNGAVFKQVETWNHKVNLASMNFDASTIESVQFSMRMPESWDRGTITFQTIWSHPRASSNFKVSWALQAAAFSNNEYADKRFGNIVTSRDTGGTTDDIYISPQSAAMTMSGNPGVGEWVIFQLSRRTNDSSNDTLAVDARMLGLTMYIKTVSGTDD